MSAELINHTALPSTTLQLNLSACKLLDTAFSLPTDCLSHFQLLQWGFGSHVPPTNPPASPSTNHPPSTGYTAITQLHRAFACVPATRTDSAARHVPPYLHMSRISSLTELKPLFDAMAMEHDCHDKTLKSKPEGFDFGHSRLVAVGMALTTDFLEPT